MWDGIASVPGYSAIRWLDAAFYKAVQVSGATWDDALRYEARAVYSLLSRRFSNWAYAASRFYVTPFSWIDTGPCGCAFESARPPDYVAAQLAAFRRWGTGRTFANYAYRGPDGFDYAPYVQTMRAASRPGIVDSQAPRLSLSSPNATPKHGRASITGTATDDFAVRLIAWRDGLGDEGVAKLTADVGSPDGAAVRWSIAGIPVVGGSNTVWLRAEDIHGLSAVARVRIRG